MADSVTGTSSAAIQSNYDKYKDYFSTESSQSLDQTDFLTLMAEQLKNQDFNNPTDNTQFIAQMAQFSALQAQQQQTYYAQAAYAASLVGKNVVVGYTGSNGKYVTEEGPITSMKFSGNDFLFMVNGVAYSATNIMEVKGGTGTSNVRLTKDVDLTKVPGLPALNGTPSVQVSVSGVQETPLTLKLTSGIADEVTAYTSTAKPAVLSITLKDMDKITTTSELMLRINDAISKSIKNPADAQKPIVTNDNFKAGSIVIKVSTSGILRDDGANLTESDIAGINTAAVKTLIGSDSIQLA